MFNAHSNTTEYNDNRIDHLTSSNVGGNQINITDSNVTMNIFALPDFNPLSKIILMVIIASVIVLLIIAMGDAFK